MSNKGNSRLWTPGDGLAEETEKTRILGEAEKQVQRAFIRVAYWRMICAALIRRMDEEQLVLTVDEIDPDLGTVEHEDLEPAPGEKTGRVLLRLEKPEKDETDD